jgi:hypothetical protein
MVVKIMKGNGENGRIGEISVVKKDFRVNLTHGKQ